jgi:VanZ family protein
MTVGYACTDEFHQLFVPGRAGLITDVLIDSIGAVFITLILHLYMNRQRIKAMDKYR